MVRHGKLRQDLGVDVMLFVSALAAAVTCASVALSETGVEMLDVPVACSVVRMYMYVPEGRSSLWC